MSSSRPWVKVWESWWTSRSHVTLSIEALGAGARMMSLANAAEPSEDGCRYCMLPTGEPMGATVLARECRLTKGKLAKVVDALVAVGTMVRRDDGAVGFVNMEKWQGAPGQHEYVAEKRGREYVYFAQAGGPAGLIKIGFSKNPWSRIRDMQTANGEPIELLATERGTLVDERALHERFANSRVNGEWFAPDPDLVGYVRSRSTATEPTTVVATKEGRGQRVEVREEKPDPPKPPAAAGRPDLDSSGARAASLRYRGDAPTPPPELQPHEWRHRWEALKAKLEAPNLPNPLSGAVKFAGALEAVQAYGVDKVLAVVEYTARQAAAGLIPAVFLGKIFAGGFEARLEAWAAAQPKPGADGRPSKIIWSPPIPGLDGGAS